MDRPLCVQNYRLIGFDVLSGISVLLEYDKLLASQDLIPYGIEETTGHACTLLLEKADQVLAGSIVIPWVPYRASHDIVARTGGCPPQVKTAVYQIASPPPATSDCRDARLLDAHYGELAMLAKLLALTPGAGTTYTSLAKAAAENAIELLGTGEPETEIYEVIKEISYDVKKNLAKIYETIEKIEQKAAETGDLERYIAKTSEAAEQPHLLKYYSDYCNNKTNLIILVPKIYVTYSLKMIIKILTDNLEDSNIVAERALIIGYDTPTVNTVEAELKGRLRHTTVSKMVISGVDERVIEKIHNVIAGSRCVLFVTILDFGKEDYLTILEALREKYHNNEIKALLQAWTLYRIRYEFRHEKANLRTRPVVVYYNLLGVSTQ